MVSTMEYLRLTIGVISNKIFYMIPGNVQERIPFIITRSVTYYPLGCDTVQSIRILPTIWRNIISPSSWTKCKLKVSRKTQAVLGALLPHV
jgi:hypothetical protein